MTIAEEFDPVCFPRHKYVYVYISRGGRRTRHVKEKVTCHCCFQSHTVKVTKFMNSSNSESYLHGPAISFSEHEMRAVNNLG